MASTSGGLRKIDDPSRLAGPEKAAVLLLALGDEQRRLWEMMDDEEIRVVSQAMVGLGNVTASAVEKLILDFVGSMSSTGSITGSVEQAQRILSAFLPKEKVETIMEELRGPAGRTMWDKLANVNEVVLANYFKNEYPQTVAVVLSKIKPDHASRVLGPLGRLRAGSGDAHAAHGAGAARNPGKDRGDAAQRVHEQSGAHLQAGQP